MDFEHLRSVGLFDLPEQLSKGGAFVASGGIEPGGRGELLHGDTVNVGVSMVIKIGPRGLMVLNKL